MLAFVAALSLIGCAPHKPHLVKATITADSKRVLVVYNASSAESKEVAEYYVAKRGIPEGNVVRIQCPEGEEVSESTYFTRIQKPIYDAIRAKSGPIDFIVLARGIPIRLADDQHYSVDAWIAAADLPIRPIRKIDEASLRGSLNPYFGSTEPFSSKEFGFFLVTRLDGYTVQDCKALVDRSLSAEPERGPFLLDEASNRATPPYGVTQAGLAKADKILRDKGFETDLDTTEAFVAPRRPVAGYASWGSNDGAFDAESYRRLRFKPGALCETFVSTSGRTFRPTIGGQSLIADLIAQGATGAKGYVSEPFTFALAKPELLFDRYTGGRNLAESFYSASQFLKWKDVVIGDPLCCPYR